MTKDEFWTRYFFRVHQVRTHLGLHLLISLVSDSNSDSLSPFDVSLMQIEVDEQRRKSVLDASQPAEDELFSWDDDETTESAPAPVTAKSSATVPATQTTPTSTLPLGAPLPVVPAPPTTAAAVPASPDLGQQTTPTSKSPVPVVREPSTGAGPPKEGSTATSPRDSEESYDLVSETSGKAAESRAASAKGETEVADKKKDVKKDDESEEDSDWE